MAKHGKKYMNALKDAPKGAVSVEEAVKFVKNHAGAKFDETVDVYMKLGVDTTKTDSPVRGVVKLPNGSGKKVRVLVFAGGDMAEAAKAAGAKLGTVARIIYGDGVHDFMMEAVPRMAMNDGVMLKSAGALKVDINPDDITEEERVNVFYELIVD